MASAQQPTSWTSRDACPGATSAADALRENDPVGLHFARTLYLADIAGPLVTSTPPESAAPDSALFQHFRRRHDHTSAAPARTKSADDGSGTVASWIVSTAASGHDQILVAIPIDVAPRGRPVDVSSEPAGQAKETALSKRAVSRYGDL